MSKSIKLFWFLFVFSYHTFAGNSDSSIKVTAYAEGYFNLANNYDESYSLPQIYVNHKDVNQLSLNTALVDLNYQKDKIRVNAGVMAGSYSIFNYNNIDQVFRYIYELNLGYKLSEKHDIWLDAGIMPSHIGTETIIGSDNMTLTRSFNAESTPYYQNGLKLSKYSKNKNWTYSLLYLNGWQIIRKAGYQQNTFGTSIIFNNTKSQFGWNTIFIKDLDTRSWIYNILFNNFYYKTKLSKSFDVLLGLDLTANDYRGGSMLNWYTTTAIASYQLNSKNKIAIRGEQYRNNVSPSWYSQLLYIPYNIDYYSGSINYDYTLQENLMFRSELKYIKAEDIHNDYFQNSYEELHLIFAFCYKFQK